MKQATLTIKRSDGEKTFWGRLDEVWREAFRELGSTAARPGAVEAVDYELESEGLRIIGTVCLTC